MQATIYNGKLMETSPQIVSDHRASLYGDGLFETILVKDGAPLFFEDHYFRIMGGMCMLRMDIPARLNHETVYDEMCLLLRHNGLTKGWAKLRWHCFREGGSPYTPLTSEVSYSLSVKAIEQPKFRENGLEIDGFFDHPKAKTPLSNLKSCNALVSVLAGVFCSENALDDALITNTDGFWIESHKGNIYTLKEGTLSTPPSTEGCVEGIVRKQMPKICEQLGLEYKEIPHKMYTLQTADELWISNAIMGVQGVQKFRNKIYPINKAKEAFQALHALPQDSGIVTN